MSTETTGEKLRRIREQRALTLSKVAGILNIDVAVLSKMERGERKLSKEIILKFAKIYKYNAEELLLQYLCDKILYEIKNEELGEKALKVAEKKVKYFKDNRLSNK